MHHLKAFKCKTKTRTICHHIKETKTTGNHRQQISMMITGRRCMQINTHLSHNRHIRTLAGISSLLNLETQMLSKEVAVKVESLIVTETISALRISLTNPLTDHKTTMRDLLALAFLNPTLLKAINLWIRVKNIRKLQREITEMIEDKAENGWEETDRCLHHNNYLLNNNSLHLTSHHNRTTITVKGNMKRRKIILLV